MNQDALSSASRRRWLEAAAAAPALLAMPGAGLAGDGGYPPGQWVISGRVVDAHGRACPGPRLRALDGGGAAECAVDADGRFVLALAGAPSAFRLQRGPGSGWQRAIITTVSVPGRDESGRLRAAVVLRA